MYLWTSWILHLQLGTSKFYLEPLLKTFETPGAFIWNPYLEPWNLPKLYLRTFAGNLDRHLEPSRTYTLTWMEPICFTWNLGIFRNLYLEPLLGTSEPSGTLYMIGTLTWNLGTCRNLYLEPLYLEPRNLRNLTWNPYLEPRNLPEPLLGTLILGTSEPSEPYLEPLLGTSEPAGTFTWNPYSEPRNLPEPLLGTLTWNLGARRNLYLEPLLGTSEPARTWRDDCPRVPQGLVWLGPQSFQLLGKKTNLSLLISQQNPNPIKPIGPHLLLFVRYPPPRRSSFSWWFGTRKRRLCRVAELRQLGFHDFAKSCRTRSLCSSLATSRILCPILLVTSRGPKETNLLRSLEVQATH